MEKILSKFISIILLDQDYENSQAVKTFLERRNSIRAFHVVRDGIEALDFILNESTIEQSSANWVILLNLDLPYCRELLFEIKKNPELKTIPVVILTDLKKSEVENKIVLPSNYYILEKKDLIKCQEVVESIENFHYTTNSIREKLKNKTLSYML